MGSDKLSVNDPYPVRVWLGYGLDRFRKQMDGRNDFYHRLGSVFIPATVQVMQPLGLTTYLPTIMPADSDPAVPDEIALVFYESRAIYQTACHDSAGGRAYAMLHETLFNFNDSPELPKSHSGFPGKFNGVLGPEFSAYHYLFDTMIDWQSGQVGVLVAMDGGDDSGAFREDLIRILTDLSHNPPLGMDGAVFAFFRGCLVFWSHWADGIPVQEEMFASITAIRMVLAVVAERLAMPLSFTDAYAGIDVTGGDSFNFQFPRRASG